MTPLQKLIYKYILENQPICDLCISNGFGFNYNQYANTHCRKLSYFGHINRSKGHCEHCNRTVILNTTINAN